MPRCAAPLHAGSGLPVTLPASEFLARDAGHLMNRCKHCHRVAARLARRYSHTLVPAALIRQQWQRYWKDQDGRARKAALLPHQRWCSRGHLTTVAAFHPFPKSRRSGYCHDCHATAQLRYHHHLRQGVWLTWEEASARHFAARNTTSQRKNRLAPKGQRWCSRHGGYYVIPAHWAQRRGHHIWCCPACAAAYYRARDAQRKAARLVQAA